MSAKPPAVNHPRGRVLFVAGRMRPIREPRPCTAGHHAGPLVDTEKFAAAGGMWATMGVCRACGSTIDRSEIRRIA